MFDDLTQSIDIAIATAFVGQNFFLESFSNFGECCLLGLVAADEYSASNFALDRGCPGLGILLFLKVFD